MISLSADDRQLTLWRIMLIFHARCFRLCISADTEHGRILQKLRQNFLHHFIGHIARSEDHRLFARYIHDRRFHADPDLSAVQQHFDLSVHILIYIFPQRRRRSARGIGTWRCHKAARCLNKSKCYFVIRETHRNRIQSAGRFFGHQIRLFEDHGQWTRPELFCQLFSIFRDLGCDL